MSLTQNYFKLSEFFVDPEMREPDACVPLDVCEKILKYHLPVLNRVRHQLGAPLIISEHSGYRPVEWETEHGRDGSSQHTFSTHGAVDLTCDENRFGELVRLLMKSGYARMIVYWHRLFVHCDFKDAELGKRFYEMTPGNVMKEVEGVRA